MYVCLAFYFRKEKKTCPNSDAYSVFWVLFPMPNVTLWRRLGPGFEGGQKILNFGRQVENRACVF